MSSLQPTGSATGNPRNKTALAPGRSLMDWVRLCNSGKDMSGTQGAILNVSLEQLMKHNKRTDAWLAIRGIVYNITEYMSFHPGGEEELMRGVGTDATKLFNNVHPWVNYESLLKSCIVGRLKTMGSSSNAEWTESIERPINDRVSSLQLQLPNKKTQSDESPNKRVFKMDWFQQASTLTLIFYLKTNSSGSTPPPQVSLTLMKNKQLRVSIEKEVNVYELEEEVRWPCYLKVHQTVAEIKFAKNSPKLWPTFGKKLNELDPEADPAEFSDMKIVHISSITHDTKLIALQYADPMLHHIHVGHHIQIKDNVDDEEVRRSYTPVSFLIKNSNLIFELPTLYFLVKEYNDGKLSRKLCSTNLGDKISMSCPRGTFNSIVLKKRTKLILFAAGTGITPMTSLIAWTLNTTRLSIKLIYFNKTENDILWRKQFDKLAAENPRFSVSHVLSQPSATWTGDKGLISLNLVKSLLTSPVLEIFIGICGPPVFNDLCVDYLKQNNFTDDSFHCFSG